jgi:hypothetical protein
LASDFCVLVCFLSSFLQVYQQAGILENSAIIYLILLFTLFLSKFFLVACSSPPTFKTKSRRNLGHIFPEQSGDPLTRNWTRQPEVYCLFYPKHTTVITSPNTASMPTTPPMGSAAPDDGEVAAAIAVTQMMHQMTRRRYVVPPHPYLHQHLHL